jgi:hypothetical protein
MPEMGEHHLDGSQRIPKRPPARAGALVLQFETYFLQLNVAAQWQLFIELTMTDVHDDAGGTVVGHKHRLRDAELPDERVHLVVQRGIGGIERADCRSAFSKSANRSLATVSASVLRLL